MPQAEPRKASQDVAREVRLLGLLLVDALETIARGRRGAAVRETRRWMCDGDERAPYSFERACEAFGLPSAVLRRRLGLRPPSARRGSARGWQRGPSR